MVIINSANVDISSCAYFGIYMHVVRISYICVKIIFIIPNIWDTYSRNTLQSNSSLSKVKLAYCCKFAKLYIYRG